MRNPVRVCNREIKKKAKNPAKIVGENLKVQRESASKTQLELAKAVTDILDVRRLISDHLEQNQPDYTIPKSTLDFIRKEILWVVNVCNQLEFYFDKADDEWLRITIGKLLNIERLVGVKVEKERKKKSLVQRQLSEKIDNILSELGINGPPNRAGISKVERGERKLDLLEAAAIAIALDIEIKDLLPTEIAAILPIIREPMKGWKPLTVWNNCKVYIHEITPGPLTLCCPEGFEIPKKAIETALSYGTYR